jgi:hypothetical protein
MLWKRRSRSSCPISIIRQSCFNRTICTILYRVSFPDKKILHNNLHSQSYILQVRFSIRWAINPYIHLQKPYRWFHYLPSYHASILLRNNHHFNSYRLHGHFFFHVKIILYTIIRLQIYKCLSHVFNHYSKSLHIDLHFL